MHKITSKYLVYDKKFRSIIAELSQVAATVSDYLARYTSYVHRHRPPQILDHSFPLLFFFFEGGNAGCFSINTVNSQSQ